MGYIALITVPVDGNTHNVAFKLTGFRSSVLGEGPVDIAAIVEADKELLEDWKATKAAKKKSELEVEMILPAFISGYVEAGQTTNRIFDILDDETFANASIGESKLDLSKQIEAKDKEIEVLKAKLLESEAAKTNEDPKSETPKEE